MMRSHTLVRRGCSDCSPDPHKLDKQKLDAIRQNKALQEAVKDEKFRRLLLTRPTLAARLLRNKLPLSILRKLRNGELARLRRDLLNPPAITLANGCAVKPKVSLNISHGDDLQKPDLDLTTGGLRHGHE
jgi:hypothetical protein